MGLHLGGCDDDRRRRLTSLGAEGRQPARDGDAEASLGELVGAEDRVGGGVQLGAIRDREAEARGRVREPVEVTPPRERLPAVHADGLEHAVPDEEAVVERGDAGRVGLEQHAVGPHVGHEPTSTGAVASASGR